ncbi:MULTISPECIES: aminotransferase class IV [Luteimonas]|uniref:aminotransferase class IV n=1 Tax=Luteimonas TaxID=83614 RepID=UPI001E374D57|nr:MULTISPECIES: aminotransferase class IV [Luteimonas]
MIRVYRDDGQLAHADDLAPPALRNDGHFTTFQLRDRAVLGLDLHVQRLVAASRSLFDATLDPARVVDALRRALDASHTRDASVRITVCPRTTGAPSAAHPMDLLVSLAPAGEPATAPLRLRSFVFQRYRAAIKHAGTFPLFDHQRRARETGADDALFVDAAGDVLEGSVWNLGLWDGRTLVWPAGDALRGTRERLLQAGLAALGVAQCTRGVALAELDAPLAAFACNARGQQAIASVDGRTLAHDSALASLLADALATQPWQPVG